eukprot:403367805
MLAKLAQKSRLNLTRNLFNYSQRDFRAALLLSGAGNQDGSDIQEAMSFMMSLSRHGSQFDIYSIDKPQQQVVNHLQKSKLSNQSTIPVQNRNMIQESDRLCNGTTKQLDTLMTNIDQYEALVIPGGVGSIFNLSENQQKTEGKLVDIEEVEIQSQVKEIIKAFQNKKKHIALSSQSVLLASKILDGKIELSIPDNNAITDNPFHNFIKTSESFTKVHRPPFQYHHDKENNVLSTPGNLYKNAAPEEIYEGIDRMIHQISLDNLTEDQKKGREAYLQNKLDKKAQAEQLKQEKEARKKLKLEQQELQIQARIKEAKQKMKLNKLKNQEEKERILKERIQKEQSQKQAASQDNGAIRTSRKY